jgi:hypothetical protein
MGCVLVLLALLLPRVTLAAIFLLTSWFQTVFATWMWPVLGFLFMPYTTLAYLAAKLNTGAGEITSGWLVILIIAVVVDLGHWGGGYRVRHRRVIVVRNRDSE